MTTTVWGRHPSPQEGVRAAFCACPENSNSGVFMEDGFEIMEDGLVRVYAGGYYHGTCASVVDAMEYLTHFPCREFPA